MLSKIDDYLIFSMLSASLTNSCADKCSIGKQTNSAPDTLTRKLNLPTEMLCKSLLRYSALLYNALAPNFSCGKREKHTATFTRNFLY